MYTCANGVPAAGRFICNNCLKLNHELRDPPNRSPGTSNEFRRAKPQQSPRPWSTIPGCAELPWIAAQTTLGWWKSRAPLEAQREEILRNYPWTKSLLSIGLRMAREPVRGSRGRWPTLSFTGHESTDCPQSADAESPPHYRRYPSGARIDSTVASSRILDDPDHIKISSIYHRKRRVIVGIRVEAR